jgi:hypothetical protein
MNKVMMEQFQKVYGYPMKIMATHGGLECALLGAKYPNWEMVSIGPTVKYPHSPDERVNIASVGRIDKHRLPRRCLHAVAESRLVRSGGAAERPVGQPAAAAVQRL